MKRTDPQNNVLQFAVPFDTPPKDAPAVVAYAFAPNGRLLATAALKEGQLELALPQGAAAGARLFFTTPPPDLARGRPPTLADMDRLHAYEPAWHFDPAARRYELQPIPEFHWRWWLWVRCRVRGTVVSPVVINGVTVEKPVGDARVHICEVDRLVLLFRKLPDNLVLRLRDEWLAVLQKPDPIGPVSAGGGFSFSPADAVAFNPQPEPPGDAVGFVPQPEPPGDRIQRSGLGRSLAAMGTRFESPLVRVGLKPQPEPPASERLAARLAPARATLADLPATTRAALGSDSAPNVREALIAHLDLLLPHFCRWPWLHRFLCRKHELTAVLTNSAGKFDTPIWYRLFGDKPDLYFWVEVQFQGTWTTVYRPCVCASTHWNYACGSEVTIRVTDPRVQPCDPNADLEGYQVVVTTIGNGISMSEIVHDPAAAARGLTTDGRPLAGNLELRCDMSRANLIAAGITHYRWSYRRLTKGDGSALAATDEWHALNTPVHRYYKVMVPDATAPGGLKPSYQPALMGPDPAFPADPLFKIQPTTPPEGSVGWKEINEHVDLAWAHFPTGNLLEPNPANPAELIPAAGKYELKLELFATSGTTATRVNWTHPPATVSGPVTALVSNSPAPFTPPDGMNTALAGVPNLYTESATGADVLGFKMVLHVDNNRCAAGIAEVWTDTPANAAGPCGFIRFNNRATSNAHIAFTARHPYDFADFHFEVDKGSSGAVAIACAGHDPAWAGVAGPTVNGFTRDTASVFTKDVPVLALLTANGTNCPEAAFAETLYVRARAVDGYTYAYWLDASATPMAFALAPRLLGPVLSAEAALAGPAVAALK